MGSINPEEYLASLENLLIFMCNTYDQQQKELAELAEKGNDAFLKVSRIQGTMNTISIAQIGALAFEHPIHSFKEVLSEMKRKRSL